jgi:H+-translocating NAD(P) transhydrogenase subunit beta
LAILPIDNTTDLSIAADAAHAVNPWVALAYLVAGVCFIIALRGLSSPSTSQRGNRFGMAGMLIAVVTTLVTHFPRTAVVHPANTACFDCSPGLDWILAGQIPPPSPSERSSA